MNQRARSIWGIKEWARLTYRRGAESQSASNRNVWRRLTRFRGLAAQAQHRGSPARHSPTDRHYVRRQFLIRRPPTSLRRRPSMIQTEEAILPQPQLCAARSSVETRGCGVPQPAKLARPPLPRAVAKGQGRVIHQRMWKTVVALLVGYNRPKPAANPKGYFLTLFRVS